MASERARSDAEQVRGLRGHDAAGFRCVDELVQEVHDRFLFVAAADRHAVARSAPRARALRRIAAHIGLWTFGSRSL